MAVYAARRIRSIHYAWIIVAVSFLALLTVSGIRSSFGVYLKPFQAELHANRANVALVASLSVLVNGMVQPIVGNLLDRYGSRLIAVISLTVAALGLIVSAFAADLWQLYISFGIIVAAAAGGPTTTMATVLVTRWFVKHRGLVMGILSSGTSAGQLVIIPLAMELNLAFGWRMSYVWLGVGIAILMIPIAILMRSNPKDIGSQPYGVGEVEASSQTGQSSTDERRTPLARAMSTHGFWMLALSFFICGYTTAGLISTHLVAFTVERGIDNMTAAAALGVMGAVNVFGTILSGIVTDRIGRKNPLAAIYFGRGLALLFLLLVTDALRLNMFAVIMGLTYIATVPPTAALTAQLFGRLSVGAIFGVIFMIHQIGAALGAYITGLIFDMTGSYSMGLILGAALCFVAAAMSFSIREKPVSRPAPAIALR